MISKSYCLISSTTLSGAAAPLVSRAEGVTDRLEDVALVGIDGVHKDLVVAGK